MPALKEKLGITLERFGQGFQSRESERFENTPYGNAQMLWKALAPDRRIDQLKSAFLKFGAYNDGEGVKPENEEQTVFCNLLNPYRSLFPEFDSFFVSLSLSDEADHISFILSVFAPPPSPKFNQDNPYAVLKILELPEQRRYEGSPIPYNVVILGESDLYIPRLNRELVGVSPEKEGIFKEHKKWSDEPKGDPEWRRHFVSETLKFLTKIAETDKEYVISSNRDAQLAFKHREQQVPWWSRSFPDKRQPGAVWPENVNLALMREGRRYRVRI